MCLSEIVLIEVKSRVPSSIALLLTTFVQYLSLNLKLGIVVRPTIIPESLYNFLPKAAIYTCVAMSCPAFMWVLQI